MCSFLSQESPLHNISEDKPQQVPSLGDLDLDDPSSLPASERPPEKPTPIAMLPSRHTANTFPRNLSKIRVLFNAQHSILSVLIR